MRRVLVGLAAVLAMALCFIPGRAIAASSDYARMRVGEERNLYLTNVERGAMNGMWISTDEDYVEIASQSTTSCTVRAKKRTGSHQVLVNCQYTYPIAIGRFTYWAMGTKDYHITVEESGSGSGSDDSGDGGEADARRDTYSIAPSASRVSIEMPYGYKTLSIVTGINLSSDVFVEENSVKGDRVSLEVAEQSGNRILYRANGLKPGRQTVEFRLIKKSGNTKIVKCRTKVIFDVTCAHVYDEGTVTSKPTQLFDGAITYTCKRCGHTKTEIIPRSTSEDSKDTDDKGGSGNGSASKDTDDKGRSNDDNASREETTNKAQCGISISPTNITLNIGEQATITVTATGDLPSHYTLSCVGGGGPFEAKWADKSSGNRRTITVTGKSMTDSRELRVWLKDSDTGELLSKASAYIKVVKSQSINGKTYYEEVLGANAGDDYGELEDE